MEARELDDLFELFCTQTSISEAEAAGVIDIDGSSSRLFDIEIFRGELVRSDSKDGSYCSARRGV